MGLWAFRVRFRFLLQFARTVCIVGGGFVGYFGSFGGGVTQFKVGVAISANHLGLVHLVLGDEVGVQVLITRTVQVLRRRDQFEIYNSEKLTEQTNE